MNQNTLHKNNNTPTTADALLTPKHVAGRWSCCVTTVLRTQGLKHIRLGKRRIRFRLGDVIALEQASTGTN